MSNNNLTVEMLDIPDLGPEEMHLGAIVNRLSAFVNASIRTYDQQEQLVQDLQDFHANMIDIKQVLLMYPYQTRAIKKALANVDYFLLAAQTFSLYVRI